ncbi:MAG TPA: glycosyltransferase family 4 protein [Gaiellaceae bacterium]|nr:glycosyltransferase family 4 protein [Gaiellaceae bacterium]
MKVVFITQAVDPRSPALGAVVPMVRALAERCDEMTVLALRAEPGVLPANCRVRTFGASTQLERTVRFTAALAREMRPQAVIAHMSPIYAVLAAPLCVPARVPILLWFTHWRNSATLRAAERVAKAIATVDRTSFPFASPKVHAIGHGIDVSEFPCRPDPGNETLHALALGRTSPAKALDSIVAAARLAQVDLEIRGPSDTDEERAYRASLGVPVQAPVTRAELPAVFARTDVLVNAAAEGSLDKVVFEACASCVPVLASNPGFASLLPEELRFERGNVEQLAQKLTALAALDREALGHELRARVQREHSVEHWADAMLGLV